MWLLGLKYLIISGYLSPTQAFTDDPHLTPVCGFLVPFHLSSGFCGVTFDPGPPGSMNAAHMAVPFPLKQHTALGIGFLQSQF